MIKQLLLILCITIPLFTGCFTKISVKPVYPFEGRYPDNTKISINNTDVVIPKGKSVWIISNDTLFNVINNAKGR